MLFTPYFKQEGLGHYDGQKCCKGCVTSTTTSHYPAIYLTIRIPATASATREVPQQWCVTTLRHHQSSRVPYGKKKVHLCDDVIKEIRIQIEHTRKICNLANKYTKSILVLSAHKIVVFLNLVAKVNEIQLVEFNFVNKTPWQ